MASKFDGGPIREALRAMPLDQRAETIVEIFRIISAEFAAMVLEHVEERGNGGNGGNDNDQLN